MAPVSTQPEFCGRAIISSLSRGETFGADLAGPSLLLQTEVDYPNM